MPEVLHKNNAYVLKGPTSYLTKTSGGDCYRTPFYGCYQIPPGVHSTRAAYPLNAGWCQGLSHTNLRLDCISYLPPKKQDIEVPPICPTVTYKQIIKLV